jgi:hypothetical protein
LSDGKELHRDEARRDIRLGECRPKRDTKQFLRFLGHVEQVTPSDQRFT